MEVVSLAFLEDIVSINPISILCCALEKQKLKAKRTMCGSEDKKDH
jgi:hypothetical protein